ncbi:hypothetical protein ASE01_19180 [Nocardioides sp. Root190]|uniref:DUF6167 family protein n=1 Tax=Nocardioides sp. Root190 TaxID=1736488 RepID=UPI0006FE44BB|nr:DUF6167 family protein [Nocardioides sp. Root190]KRB74112.1 hypothetical protein ASE01_19180 [Nocardioides sp. Root190]
MKAGLWFTAGAAAGVYGMVRVRRIAEAFTPDGMRDRIGAAFVGARMFRDEVVQGQVDAESQLREHFRALEAGPRRADPPTALEKSSTMTASLAAPNPTTKDGPR